MTDKICCIFPAFGSDYTGSENQFILEYSSNAREFFLEASSLLKIDFEFYNLSNENMVKDELTSQYVTYIYSSIISKVLKYKFKIVPYTAGYSMGLYAALFHSESISFTDGLLLIQKAYELISESLKNEKFLMSSIIGLEQKDVEALIKKYSKKSGIININNKNSFVISGEAAEVKKIMDAAKKEGALSVKELAINTPYHTPYINAKTREMFAKTVKSIKIKKPIYKIISNIDQRIITTKEDIVKELIDNLNKKQNWHKTMNKLIKLKNNTYFEAGPSKSLLKISRFIDGDYKIYTLKELNDLIMS